MCNMQIYVHVNIWANKKYNVFPVFNKFVQFFFLSNRLDLSAEILSCHSSVVHIYEKKVIQWVNTIVAQY